MKKYTGIQKLSTAQKNLHKIHTFQNFILFMTLKNGKLNSILFQVFHTAYLPVLSRTPKLYGHWGWSNPCKWLTKQTHQYFASRLLTLLSLASACSAAVQSPRWHDLLKVNCCSHCIHRGAYWEWGRNRDLVVFRISLDKSYSPWKITSIYI